jgi:hypothetical protein
MRGTLRAGPRSDHPQADPFLRGRAGDGCDKALGMDGAFDHIRLRGPPRSAELAVGMN